MRKGNIMSFKFFGIEIPDSVKVVLSFNKKEDGTFTFISQLIDNNGMAYMRTNPRPVVEGQIDLPWEALLTQERFVKAFVAALPVASEA